MRSRLPSLVFCLLPLTIRLHADEPAKPAPPKFKIADHVEFLHDVEIGKGGEKTLHAEIARPKEIPAAPMPAVLWIHGGGWSGGSHKGGDPAVGLALHGYFIASIEYRLSGEAKWPAQIEDCKLGVRWLRANAEIYHVNPDRIGCWGSSAGGHLVACLGVMGDEKPFEGPGGYEGVSSKVQAVVDYCGPADFAMGAPGIQGAPAGHAPALTGLFGGPFDQKTELWKQGSPMAYVKAGDPPFLIVHGDNDKTVPHAQSEALDAALKSAGVPVTLITVKNGTHSMGAAPDSPPAEPNQKELQAAVAAFFDKELKK